MNERGIDLLVASDSILRCDQNNCGSNDGSFMEALSCVRKCRQLRGGGGGGGEGGGREYHGRDRGRGCMHACEACPNLKPNLPLSFDED